jgi:hypothetical protein
MTVVITASCCLQVPSRNFIVDRTFWRKIISFLAHATKFGVRSGSMGN